MKNFFFFLFLFFSLFSFFLWKRTANVILFNSVSYCIFILAGQGFLMCFVWYESRCMSVHHLFQVEDAEYGIQLFIIVTIFDKTRS